MHLRKLVDEYSISRGLTASSRTYYLRCVRQFERHVRETPTVQILSEDSVNRFLHSLRRLTPHYRKSLRTGLLCLWSWAATKGYCESPGEVARVRLPKAPVTTWSQSEVRLLLCHAERLSGQFRGPLRQPRGRYMSTLLVAAWYLGMSQCDLHRIRFEDFDCGNLCMCRQKTGQRVTVGIPRAAWQSIVAYHAIARIKPRRPLWELWGSREAFRKCFRSVTDSAGLTGPWKTLRATAGTYYEIAHPGQGHLFLGNTRDVFMRNYFDPRRQPDTLPHAPEL